MPTPGDDLAEVARRAWETYDRDLRPLVEPEHVGEFLALDVDTGDYEIDADELPALHRLEARKPGGARSRFLFRVGYEATHVIGGSLTSLRRWGDRPIQARADPLGWIGPGHRRDCHG